jgi:hypothetical protein
MIKGSEPIAANELGIPAEIWLNIASYFSAIDLNRFIRTTKLFQDIGTDHTVTRPIVTTLYHRLRKLDITLPEKLMTADPINEYLAARRKVSQSQQEEIFELTRHHPTIALPHMNMVKSKLGTMTKLERLEALDLILDQINIEIITPCMDHNGTKLDIAKLGITRLPQRLYKDPANQNYFNNLSEIDCSNNHIKVLILDDLPALSTVDCPHNGMSALVLGNLPCLIDLDCSHNHLQGSLDLRHYSHFFALGCNHNKLTAVYLSKILELEYFNCSHNQLRELHIDGNAISYIDCTYNLLHSLQIDHINELSNDEHSPCLIHDNYLEKIPENLATKFGEPWSQQQLGRQHKPVITVPKDSPVELPDPRPDVIIFSLPATSQKRPDDDDPQQSPSKAHRRNP